MLIECVFSQSHLCVFMCVCARPKLKSFAKSSLSNNYNIYKQDLGDIINCCLSHFYGVLLLSESCHMIEFFGPLSLINRPGVARAVLQSPPSLFH